MEGETVYYSGFCGSESGYYYKIMCESGLKKYYIPPHWTPIPFENLTRDKYSVY